MTSAAPGPNKERFDLLKTAIGGMIQADKFDRVFQVFGGVFVALFCFAVSKDEMIGLVVGFLGFFVGFSVTGTLRKLRETTTAISGHLHYIHELQSEALDYAQRTSSK